MTPETTIDEPDEELLATELDQLMVAVADIDPDVTLVHEADEIAEHADGREEDA